MTMTPEDVLSLFSSLNASPFWELTGETHQERLERIAEEINSGQRTIAHVTSAIEGIVSRMADQGTTKIFYPPGSFVPRPTVYGSSGEDTELWIPLWMRGTALEEIYREAWITYGNTRYALAVVQEHPIYDTIFPGNRREDGSIRLPESEYLSVLEGYEDAFESVGLNPDLFRSGFVAGIEMNLSPDELYSTRLLPVWEQVINAGDAIRAEYAELWNLNLTDAAILASILDPNIGTGVLNRTISQAEISGRAMESGFDISSQFRDVLLESGVNKESATNLFQTAEGLLPILETLRARHTDSEDVFDIEEFAGASIFRDPQESLRMRRILQAERASFQPNTSLVMQRDEFNRVVGLARI